MIANNGADRAGDVDNFGGSKLGRERGYDAAARHGNLYVAETHERMTAEIDAVGLHSRDSGGGVDGGISLDENHAGHVTSHELSIVGPRRWRSALRCDEGVALQLVRGL